MIQYDMAAKHQANKLKKLDPFIFVYKKIWAWLAQNDFITGTAELLHLL